MNGNNRVLFIYGYLLTLILYLCEKYETTNKIVSQMRHYFIRVVPILFLSINNFVKLYNDILRSFDSVVSALYASSFKVPILSNVQVYIHNSVIMYSLIFFKFPADNQRQLQIPRCVFEFTYVYFIEILLVQLTILSQLPHRNA